MSAATSDLNARVTKTMELGMFDEPGQTALERARIELQQLGPIAGAPRSDLAMADWVEEQLKRVRSALRQEICDPAAGKMKAQYEQTLNKGLTQEGVVVVGNVILRILTTINPALAVSSVAVYLAIWLVKVGVNSWCSTPPAAVTA